MKPSEQIKQWMSWDYAHSREDVENKPGYYLSFSPFERAVLEFLDDKYKEE